MRNAARMRLAEHTAARFGSAVEQIEAVLGSDVTRRQSERDRNTAFHREVAQSVVHPFAYFGVGGAVVAFARVLEYSVACRAYGAHELGELFPRGMIRCDWPVIRFGKPVT